MATLALFIFGTALIHRLLIVNFHYPYNYTEGIIAATFLNTDIYPWMYGDWNQSPFILMPYNPLFPYAAHWLSQFSDNAYLGGRVLAWVCALGSYIIIFFSLRKCSVKTTMAIWWAALPCALPIISKNLVSMIPDYGALFFTLLGLYCFLPTQTPIKPHHKRWWIGIIALTIAFFFKQNFIWGLCAVGLHLLLHKRFKDTLVYSAIALCFLLIPIVILQILTDGQYWLHATFSPATLKMWQAQSFVRYWSLFIEESLWVAPIALIGMCLALYRSWRHPITLYMLLCLLSSVFLGKVGSGDNYFIEITAAISLASAWGWSLFRNTKITLFMWLALAPFTWFAFQKSIPEFRGIPTTYQAIANSELPWDELGVLIKKGKREMIIENPGLLVSYGQRVVYEPFEFRQLAAQGKFDENLVINKIDAHDYDFIILTTSTYRMPYTSRFSSRFLNKVRQRYKVLGSKHGQVFLVPN